MRQKSGPEKQPAEDAIRDVRRATRRMVRDYGKYDRREASQYYVDAKGVKTVHA